MEAKPNFKEPAMSLDINDINNLTNEEVAALNKKLTRQLGKFILTRVAVGVTVVVVCNYLARKLDVPDVIDAATPVPAYPTKSQESCTSTYMDSSFQPQKKNMPHNERS